MQNVFLQVWAEANHIIGAGGGVGYAVGTKFLEALLNKPGAILVLVCIYLVSLILLTGLHPVQFSRGVISYVVGWWNGRAERKLDSAEKAEAREQRRMERDNRLSKKNPLFEDGEI